MLSCPDAEPYVLVRPALPDEAVVATGRTCELWIDWFCQGSRTKSYMIKGGVRREKKTWHSSKENICQAKGSILPHKLVVEKGTSDQV